MLREVKPDVEQADEEFQQIGQLVGDPRWQSLRKVMEGRIQALETLIDKALTDEFREVPKDPTNIGFMFLAAKVAITHLYQVMTLPDDIQEEAALRREGKTGGKGGV